MHGKRRFFLVIVCLTLGSMAGCIHGGPSSGVPHSFFSDMMRLENK